MCNYDTTDFYSFIKEHIDDDIHTLLLKKNKNFPFDYIFAVEQIEIRKKIKQKLPSWHKNYRLIFPSKLSYEQASSEITARYKQRLLQGSSVCDLTGGLGIDSFYLSQVAKQAIYVEISRDYCEAAVHNFAELGVSSIQVVHDNCEHYIDSTNCFSDTYYIDPARRGYENRRLYALSDCEPDILKLKDKILSKGKRLIVKSSPMLDIHASLQAFGDVAQVHILSVKNECKELLFVIDNASTGKDTQLVCVNFSTSDKEQIYIAGFKEEKENTPVVLGELRKFLYEPNASILKAGLFRSISAKYHIDKLHINSHLYTSDEMVDYFPGRIFEITESFDFSKKNMASVARKYPQANISVRNFPLPADVLRGKMRIKEGGDIYLFATTLFPNNKKLVIGRKITD